MNNLLNKYLYDFRLNIIIDIASVIVLVNVAVSSQPKSLLAVSSYVVLVILAVALIVRIAQITKMVKKEEVNFEDRHGGEQGIAENPGGKRGIYPVMSSLSLVALVLLVAFVAGNDPVSSWIVYALILFYCTMIIVGIIFFHKSDRERKKKEGL